MRIAAIVQARMSSRRFPGKVLYRVAGKPLLGYLFERLKRCLELDEIVLATSIAPEDAAIAAWCRSEKIFCLRGSLANVAERFLTVLDHIGVAAFVRVNGDSPLLDPRLIDAAVVRFRSSKSHLVSNVVRRTFPSGQSVEVVCGTAFRSAYPLMSEPADFEHVTRYFYRRPDQFSLLGMEASSDFSDIRLSVDTPDDMSLFAGIVRLMNRPHWEYGLDEILSLYHQVTSRRVA